MIETNPQFPEILPVIEQYLKDCKKEGKPMRIHFWDTNHQLDAAKQITADSSLHNLAKKYGSPLYVIEIVGGDDFTKLVPGYLAGDKHATKRIIEDYNFKSNKGKSVLKIVDYAKNDPNTRVLFPDHREAEVKAFVNSMPADEQVLYKKFDTLIKKAQKN